MRNIIAFQHISETILPIGRKINFSIIINRATINQLNRRKYYNDKFGFYGNLTSSKWAKIAKCSKDTAIRDINDLINKNVLKKEEAEGRSTSYILNDNFVS